MPASKIERTCGQCGTSFLGRPNYKYCTPECRSEAQSKNSRGRDLGSTAERTYFLGIAYYRYPNSSRPSHRAYFQRPGKTLHRAVYEHHHGPVPDGHEVHHIDHDTLNNDSSNLACIPQSDHRRESQAARRLQDYSCAWCGKDFQAIRQSNRTRRYCSRNHAQKHRYHQRKGPGL